MEFTQDQQEHINQLLAAEKGKWETDVLKPLTEERDSLLQFKPVDKSDAEKQLEQREKELFSKEISIELKANQLEDFSELFQVSNKEELESKIKQVKKILDVRKLSANYVPEDKRQSNAYDQAAKNDDVNGMISAKLSKLFQ